MRSPHGLPARLRNLASDQNGQVTTFVVILAVAIVMFAGLVVDGGLALAAKIRAIGEAQEAARAGAQALDLAAYRDSGTVRLVPAHARTRAQTYLASTSDTGTITTTGNKVTVTVTAHQHTQLLGLLGLDSLTVTGTGSAHPVHGITAPVREFGISEGSLGGNSRVVGAGG